MPQSLRIRDQSAGFDQLIRRYEFAGQPLSWSAEKLQVVADAKIAARPSDFLLGALYGQLELTLGTARAHWEVSDLVFETSADHRLEAIEVKVNTCHPSGLADLNAIVLGLAALWAGIEPSEFEIQE